LANNGLFNYYATITIIREHLCFKQKFNLFLEQNPFNLFPNSCRAIILRLGMDKKEQVTAMAGCCYWAVARCGGGSKNYENYELGINRA